MDLVWFSLANPPTQPLLKVPFEIMTKIDDSHFLYSTFVLLEKASYYGYFLEYSDGKSHFLTDTFKTSCISGPLSACYPIRLGFVSDNQFGAVTFKQLTNQISRYSPHYLLHVGDAVQNPRDLAQWQTDFFDILSFSKLGQSSPIIHSPGNHDDELIFNTKSSYLTSPSGKWRSLTIGKVRIITLTSNIDTEEQEVFLQNECMGEEYKEAYFRIVMVHIPPFVEWWNPDTWDKGEKHWGRFIQTRFVPLFEKCKVDLVVSGHQHNYQRGERNGVKYAIIGGGGGTLEDTQVEDWQMYHATFNIHHFVIVDVYVNQIYWRAFDISGELIDSFSIRKMQLLPSDPEPENPSNEL